jgi:hypothetical protein
MGPSQRYPRLAGRGKPSDAPRAVAPPGNGGDACTSRSGPETWTSGWTKRPRRPAGAAPLLPGWGIAERSWLWPVQIRILIVTDGRITTSDDPYEFGLGPVIDTLRDGSFAWWVRFLVDVRKRDEPEGFRFDGPGFDIAAYHQIWFFGDWPGEEANPPTIGDEIIHRPEFAPLTDNELRIVAEFMDRGGGVFATGDHTLLGASMCHRIPRVRTMRRWTRAQGVPAFDGPERLDTLARGPGSDFDWEGDGRSQPIYPVFRPGPHQFALDASPHPLLCGTRGVIHRFPDHMHEGAVFDDHEVDLDRPLDIPGYSAPEYPLLEPTTAIARTFMAGFDAGAVGAAAPRPRPEVIAYGQTRHLSVPRVFPMISVYDGEPVGLGRVVTESTWHHWFSMNLVGLREMAPLTYRGMQEYYRNVALWLATPAQRRLMLFAGIWGVIVGSHPGAFDRALGTWGIGARVVAVLGRTMPSCTMRDLITTTADVGRVLAANPRATPGREVEIEHRARIWGIPAETVDTVLVGGIASEMIDLAHDLFNAAAHGRESPLDIEAVEKLGAEGVLAARRTLAEALVDGAERYAALADGLAGSPRQANEGAGTA